MFYFCHLLHIFTSLVTSVKIRVSQWIQSTAILREGDLVGGSNQSVARHGLFSERNCLNCDQ